MIETITENIPMIITAIATIGIVRAYMQKILLLSKDVQELQVAILDAMEDNVITAEELERIKKEAADIPKAVKGINDHLKKLWNKIFRR